MYCRKIWVISCLLLFCVGSLLYGGTTGKIAGRVIGTDTGDPLMGANVFIENTSLGAATDADGEYYIINIPPGTYNVKVQMMGYITQRVENIRVTVDLTTQLNFDLDMTVLDAQESVVITAQREIQKDLTSSEVSISSDQIEALPVKGVSEILDLQAGVVRDAAGELHIRGGRTNEITYMVDGVQVINPLYRSSGISIDDQAIEELKAITGTFNAEYGQALSGVVNIVTKKGSDKFSINATAYFGDHLSFDNDLYSVMDNTEWMNMMARAISEENYLTLDDFLAYMDQNYHLTLEQVIEKSMSGEKPWLEKKPYLNSYEPWKNRDLQLNLSGPVPGTGKRISYFLSGRYRYNPGHEHGKRYFMPWGYQSPESDALHTFETADNEIVPLYLFEGVSTQSKIYFQLTNALTLSYGIYYNKDHTYQFDLTYPSYQYKYVPDAGRNYYTDRYTQILALTYVFSKSTFLDLKANTYYNHHKEYLYEDPYDYRYMPTNAGDFAQYVFNPSREENIYASTQPSDFRYWGNDPTRTTNITKYTSINADLTSQVTKRHLIKTGFSARLHDLSRENYNLQFSQVDYRPIIPDKSSPYRTDYEAKPKEMAAYIQDKIEFNELIINIGLRFDYFDSDGRVLTDPMDPQIYKPFKLEHIYKDYVPGMPDSLLDQLTEYTPEERAAFWYKKAKPKYQISPRFGISFPVTDQGVIHFSYGHFFQNPEFQYLYENPNFWIAGAGSRNLVGNADLDAERTVMYELGLQQRLMDNMDFDLTGFYRDIRDWVGTGFPIDTYRGSTYYSYANRDHAKAKGITLSTTYRSRNLSINFDYSYMVAKGTSSNPIDAYNDIAAGKAPRVQLVNLNWDQRQSVNIVLTYSKHGWITTLSGTMNSGLPYTPSFVRGESTGGSATVGLQENSERRPTLYNLDLRLSKSIHVFRTQVTFFCNVTNLLDIRGVQNVYADTGKPDYSLENYTLADRIVELSSIEEYYARPGNYTGPRFINLGVRLSY